MGIYDNANFNRILGTIQKVAIEKQGPISPADVKGVDIMHYTADWSELDHLMENAKGVRTILDIGSGPGGAARYLANKYDIEITNWEYQQDLAGLCKRINEEYTKSGAEWPRKISIHQGDFLQYSPSKPFDLVTAQQVILHIPDKASIFSKLAECSDKYVYIEDFVSDGVEFDEEDRELLKNQFHADSLMSIEEYRAKLSDHGFEILSLENVTKEWSKFVWTRCNNHIANREAYIAGPGSSEECWANNLNTYTSACKLYHIEDPENYPHVPIGPEHNKKPQAVNGAVIFGKKK